MKAKVRERAEARLLRREKGLPMKVIAARLGVSPGSIHLWTSDIDVAPEHAAHNLARARAAFAETWAQLHRDRRRAAQREGRDRARTQDSLHQAGCMLYWAEGGKGRNALQFCNSDPRMLAFFRRFVCDCFDVDPSDFKLRLHVYLNGSLSLEGIERHWLQALEIPATCIRGHSLNPLPTSSSGKKRHRLPYGVATLYLYRTDIVQHIYGAIQEYGGFEEPRWLDGPPRKPKRPKAPAVVESSTEQ